MKRMIFIVLFALMASISFAQQHDIDVMSIGDEIVKIYETDANNAKTKHLLAKEWVAKTFGDYKSVLQFEDDENCKIIIKGFTPLSDDSKLSYTITMDSKDEKYRVRIGDLVVKDYKVDPLKYIDSDDQDLLSALGINAAKLMDMDFHDYVNVYSQIDANTESIKMCIDKENSYKAEIEKAVNEKTTYENKPFATPKSWYRDAKNKEISELNKQLQATELARIIKERENDALEKRHSDIKIGLENILKSLFVSLNTNDEF